MQHLINFSNHNYDIKQFNNCEKDLTSFLNKHQLDGIELLIGYESATPFPKEKIFGVHLPFWVTWLDIWNEKADAIDKYYTGVDNDHLKYMSGGCNREEMVSNLAKLWKVASDLGANYAVMHACHVELDHAFTRKYTYTNHEVLRAFAELLNDTAALFPNEEPPVKIAIENLWWPGLTFTNQSETQEFIRMLNFNNWSFVLDTGHLLNTNHEFEDEKAGINFLVETILNTPKEIIERIEVIHLCYSSSKEYQIDTIRKGLPENFHKLEYSEKYILARDNAMEIDQHRPFTNKAINEVISLISPKFLVHEFLGSITNKDEFLKTQQSIIT